MRYQGAHHQGFYSTKRSFEEGVPKQDLDIAQSGQQVPVMDDPKSLPADKFGYACATAGNVYCFGSLLAPFDRNRGQDNRKQTAHPLSWAEVQCSKGLPSSTNPKALLLRLRNIEEEFGNKRERGG
jgi:hypothetical protein